MNAPGLPLLVMVTPADVTDRDAAGDASEVVGQDADLGPADVGGGGAVDAGTCVCIWISLAESQEPIHANTGTAADCGDVQARGPGPPGWGAAPVKPPTALQTRYADRPGSPPREQFRATPRAGQTCWVPFALWRTSAPAVTGP